MTVRNVRKRPIRTSSDMLLGVRNVRETYRSRTFGRSIGIDHRGILIGI